MSESTDRSISASLIHRKLSQNRELFRMIKSYTEYSGHFAEIVEQAMDFSDRRLTTALIESTTHAY